jgi:hypothetical protein
MDMTYIRAGMSSVKPKTHSKAHFVVFFTGDILRNLESRQGTREDCFYRKRTGNKRMDENFEEEMYK